ncbi:hypothetical protein N865_00605 [Intrasporangium oryzae NRRL B-24470]|uniref:Acyltransferase 3 domain-containing protein n=1 Tax=Intrasporangium oryzae NRRL B-24470 TaxID=1386089 RepID=W9G9U9_9MICO|nr:acyltransferase [Intrasporangium oryzae]EWT02976.1 hypothetical protein N865_00605 [Intrasporangium oryzae NRRL B-24470]
MSAPPAESAAEPEAQTALDPAPVRSISRISALDGLRGLAVLLVAVGHAGDQLWPRSLVNEVPVLRGFFGGGAVVIFFVVGGLIVTRGLLRDHAEGALDPVRFYLRRLVRVGAQLLPLALAVLVVSRVDATDRTPPAVTAQSLMHVLTQTWNTYTQDNLLASRSDLGHLWYLSVQQQCYLLLPLLVAVLAVHRRVFAGLLLALVVAVTVWRYHVLDTDGWVIAATATTTRADGLIMGVLLAVALPFLTRFRDRAAMVMTVSGVAMVVLIGVLQELAPFQFLREWGIVFTLVTAAMVAAIFIAQGPSAVSRLLSKPALTYLGRASLAIFVWHLPVFAFVARHTTTWDWMPRTILGASLLAAVVWTTHRWFDEPARRWLAVHLRPRPAAYAPATSRPETASSPA